MTRKASDAAIEPYAALKAFGYSPDKALEIMMDYKRGDQFAKLWVARAIAAQGGERG